MFMSTKQIFLVLLLMLYKTELLGLIHDLLIARRLFHKDTQCSGSSVPFTI